MKKLYYLQLFGIVFSIFSCEKSKDIPMVQGEQIVKEYNFEDFKVVDNRLYFENIDDFVSAMEEFSDKENETYSFDKYESWSKINNFEPYKILDLFNEDEDDLGNEGYILNSLLNKDHEVQIGESITFLGDNFQISIHTGSYSKEKMANAKRNLRTNVQEGVFVGNLKELKERLVRSYCGNTRECVTHDGTEKYKISGTWNVSGSFSPEWGYDNYGQLVLLGYNIGCWHHCIMKSYKRKKKGKRWKKNHYDDLKWSTGYGTNCNSSGTGWTSNTWKIEIAEAICDAILFPISEGPNYPGCYYVYNNTYVGNETVGFSCEDDCF